MLKDIEVTLYDIFGYLLPGLTSLAGIAILFWAICYPGTPLRVPETLSANWWAVVIPAYIVGHLTQAVANMVEKHLPQIEDRVLSERWAGHLPGALVSAARSKVGRIAGMPPEQIDSDLLYRICDEVVLQSGVTADRDLYIYREGFYRGLAVSFLLLLVSLVVRALAPGASLSISGSLHPVTKGALSFGALLSLIGIVLCYVRYRRFGGYRATQAVLGFLVIEGKQAEKRADK